MAVNSDCNPVCKGLVIIQYQEIILLDNSGGFKNMIYTLHSPATLTGTLAD